MFQENSVSAGVRITLHLRKQGLISRHGYCVCMIDGMIVSWLKEQEYQTEERHKHYWCSYCSMHSRRATRTGVLGILRHVDWKTARKSFLWSRDDAWRKEWEWGGWEALSSVDQTALVTFMFCWPCINVQGGSSMTGTDLCVNKCKQSRSYLNHLV